jgi:hypothetical protein
MLFSNSITFKFRTYTETGLIQMIQVEPILLKNYCAILNKNRMPENEQHAFIKWLRYYLDFCHKYGFDKTGTKSLTQFIEKLRSRTIKDSRSPLDF